MAATMAGAWKAYLESQGLGVPVYRDGAPKPTTDATEPSTSWPYIVVQEGIGFDLQGDGDYGDPNATNSVLELVQIDLYQHVRALGGAAGVTTVTENYALPDRLMHLVRGLGIRPYAPWPVYGVPRVNAQRWPISDNVLRHTWTVGVARQVERRP